MCEILVDRVFTQNREDLSLGKRVEFSLRDTFLSLPHLMVRIRYLSIALLVNCLWYCNFEEAYKNLEDIVVTVLYDSLLTITGLVSLILSPYTNRINQFNSGLNYYFLTHSTLIEIAPRLFKNCTWLRNPTITNLFLKMI